MNALIRFWRQGAEDADRRMAEILSPSPAGAGDRYLMSSSLVRSFDRFTSAVQVLAATSQTARAASALRTAWHGTDWRERYRSIGVLLMIAVGVHVLTTVLQGQPPDWFKAIVPVLTGTFAVLLLIASRSTHD